MEPIAQPDEIRAFRRRFGLTQTELGAYLGVPKMTVSRWERGANPPSPYLGLALEGLAARLTRRCSDAA